MTFSVGVVCKIAKVGGVGTPGRECLRAVPWFILDPHVSGVTACVC